MNPGAEQGSGHSSLLEKRVQRVVRDAMTTQNIHHPKDGTATEASGERSGNAN